MRLRDIPTNSQTLELAENVRRKLLKRASYASTERIRVGPRYLIDDGRYQNKQAIFKMCVFTRTRHRETYEKFSREILFLNFLADARYPKLRRAAPKVYASGLGTRPWYIREYIQGAPQNVAGGIARIRPAFFTERSATWVIGLLDELHRIREQELPRAFRSFLYRPFTVAKLWGFIRPHRAKIDRTLGERGTLDRIYQIVRRHAGLYDHAPWTLGHQELYGPHILIRGNKRRLIDWENIGWSAPTSDPATLWLRAHAHPHWQDLLYHGSAHLWRSIPQYEQLFTTTVLIHSVFNVINLHYTNNLPDLRGLILASQRIIRRALANQPVLPPIRRS